MDSIEGVRGPKIDRPYCRRLVEDLRAAERGFRRSFHRESDKNRTDLLYRAERLANLANAYERADRLEGRRVLVDGLELFLRSRELIGGEEFLQAATFASFLLDLYDRTGPGAALSFREAA